LYNELAPRCIDEPLLAQEAMMGKATAEESLAGIEPNAEKSSGEDAEVVGSLDKALQYYRDLARLYPASILGKKAEQRANELEQQNSRAQVDQFYAEANKKAAPKAASPAKTK